MWFLKVILEKFEIICIELVISGFGIQIRYWKVFWISNFKVSRSLTAQVGNLFYWDLLIKQQVSVSITWGWNSCLVCNKKMEWGCLWNLRLWYRIAPGSVIYGRIDKNKTKNPSLPLHILSSECVCMCMLFPVCAVHVYVCWVNTRKQLPNPNTSCLLYKQVCD